MLSREAAGERRTRPVGGAFRAALGFALLVFTIDIFVGNPDYRLTQA